MLLAEAGPVYRRKLAGRLTAAEAEREARAEAERVRQAQEAEERRRREQEEADRQAERDRIEEDRRRALEQQEEDRRRRLAREDEDRRAELEQRRRSQEAAHALELRRLELEERRLVMAATPQSRPAAHPRPGVSAGPLNGHQSAAPAPTGHQVPAPAPKASTAALERPAAPAVLEARTHASASGRITARVEDAEEVEGIKGQEHEPPAARPAKAALPKDWELPDLPADCAPGRAPELLTDAQSRARIRYGLGRGWTQRRIGEFAGRSATTVNKMAKAALEAGS